MLLAGTYDGLYRITTPLNEDRSTIARTLAAEEVWRIHQLDEREGLLVTAGSGGYHSTDGEDWSRLPLPGEQVLAVAEHPVEPLLYVGTDPSMIYKIDISEGLPVSAEAWNVVSGFRDLKQDHDWGIPRHDGRSKLRSIRIHPADPDRIVVGIEVGGIYVSDDGGSTWEDRRITGHEAPHMDDIHHLEVGASETMVASTGSGLYLTTNGGESWIRLDEDVSQRYFRESLLHDGVIYAGGAPASSASWNENDDHALFECRDGRRLQEVPSPVEDEVAVGWGCVQNQVVAATHRGTLLVREADGWSATAEIPHPDESLSRYAPLLQYTGEGRD